MRHGPDIRIGIGYDAHRLTPGRPLVLGGVEIPWEKGLLGHSDADVLLHALCDALLGALGEGDLGRHFPDTDPAFRGVSSRWLLDQVMQRVREQGFRVGNVDAVVVAQAPRLSAHLPRMQARLAEALGVPPACVNLKATTTEGMGFAGREEGMAAYAVCTLMAAEE